MTTPTSRNRLDGEQSPYLEAHADNPVNWQPWDDRALETAAKHDVPIFLSIGYSACHWCHVMAEESFEDEETADLLNEQFVPIKIDREERPDIDSIYMRICQLVTGGGGWPLSVWLTPEGEPFYVGTYFPPEPKRGQPGFKQLLGDIRDSWADPDERADIEQRAAKWARAVEDDLEDVPDQPGPPEEGVLERAARAAVDGADREHGGWGRGQKFPQPGRLQILARTIGRAGPETVDAGDGTLAGDSLAVLTETLDAMADGGLYDHLGGGFHRYTVDREWVVPHFEKMLYDNAEIPRAFLAGYQLTGDERYATVAAESFAFLERELQHPEGGFYSTLDARSERDGERVEGAYYVWTPQEVREVLDGTDADLFCDRYGITAGGNFEGRTVLTRSASIEELAADYDLSETAVRERLDEASERVQATREERPRPPRDEKVLAGWNGLAVSAFAEGALVLDEGYAAPAVDALGFVRDRLWDADERRLSRRFKGGERKGEGYLEDYAFLGRGALELFGATGEVDHLAFALELARAIEERFWDAEAGTLYFTPTGGEELIARPQEVTDGSTPSSGGVAAALLLALDGFTTRDFAGIAETVIDTHGSAVDGNPLQHATLALAADALAEGHVELTLTADDPPAEWRATIGSSYVPAQLLAWRPADDEGLAAWLDRLGLSEAPPIWAGRGPHDGAAAVYACRSFACSPPKPTVEEALVWARS